jgi:hypothetical protein
MNRQGPPQQGRQATTGHTAPAPGPLRHSGRRGLRFPCGHTADEAGVARRLRTRPRALWVPCPHCNVVALLVAAPETTAGPR